jgi:hypothetical protein
VLFAVRGVKPSAICSRTSASYVWLFDTRTKDKLEYIDLNSTMEYEVLNNDDRRLQEIMKMFKYQIKYLVV